MAAVAVQTPLQSRISYNQLHTIFTAHNLPSSWQLMFQKLQHYHNTTGQIYISDSKLAGFYQRSRKTASRFIGWLKAQGLITVRYSKGKTENGWVRHISFVLDAFPEEITAGLPFAVDIPPDHCGASNDAAPTVGHGGQNDPSGGSKCPTIETTDIHHRENNTDRAADITETDEKNAEKPNVDSRVDEVALERWVSHRKKHRYAVIDREAIAENLARIPLAEQSDAVLYSIAGDYRQVFARPEQKKKRYSFFELASGAYLKDRDHHTPSPNTASVAQSAGDFEQQYRQHQIANNTQNLPYTR